MNIQRTGKLGHAAERRSKVFLRFTSPGGPRHILLILRSTSIYKYTVKKRYSHPLTRLSYPSLKIGGTRASHRPAQLWSSAPFPFSLLLSSAFIIVSTSL